MCLLWGKREKHCGKKSIPPGAGKHDVNHVHTIFTDSSILDEVFQQKISPNINTMTSEPIETIRKVFNKLI